MLKLLIHDKYLHVMCASGVSGFLSKSLSDHNTQIVTLKVQNSQFKVLSLKFTIQV